MKLLFRLSIVAAAGGLGLAAGWLLRAKPPGSAADSQAPAATAVATGNGFAPPKAGASAGAFDDSPLTTKLERELSMSAGVTRWLYWLEALEQAAPSDFSRLARLAQGDPVALRLVAGRWAEVAARQLFDALAGASRGGARLPVDELARALFDEWPKRDPAAAIAALNEPGDIGLRGEWRRRVATRVFDQDVEGGLRLMAEWHIENYGPLMTGVPKWAAADPRHAAEFTSANGVGCVAELTMEAIGKQWGQTDPAAALEFASGKPGGLGWVLAGAALKQWAKQDLEAAAAWLGQADARMRNRLCPAFVEAWAQKDASGALAWCDENLEGSCLAQAVGGVMKGAATKDVAGAAALVAAMAPSPARNEAAAAVAKKWFPGLSAASSVKPETIAWLAGLDHDALKRVVDEVQWGWATSDPKTMAGFLASASSQQIPANAYTILARQLARQNPAEAIEWVGRLPAERALTAGSDAFAEWWDSQPEAAAKWLNALPMGDARRQPFFQCAVRTLAYRPQGAEELAALSDADRAAARKVIAGMTLPEDRRARLLDALR